MKFKIVCNGIVIGIFLSETDRDLGMDILTTTYDDCTFEAQDD